MTLEIYPVVLQLVREVGVILPRLRARSAALGDQVERALVSIPLNTAEGAYSRGKNRQARGTHGEIGTGLGDRSGSHSGSYVWMWLTGAAEGLGDAALQPLHDVLVASLELGQTHGGDSLRGIMERDVDSLVVGEIYPRAAYATALLDAPCAERPPLVVAKTDAAAREIAVRQLRGAGGYVKLASSSTNSMPHGRTRTTSTRA